jgi:hypothetical protein
MNSGLLEQSCISNNDIHDQQGLRSRFGPAAKPTYEDTSVQLSPLIIFGIQWKEPLSANTRRNMSVNMFGSGWRTIDTRTVHPYVISVTFGMLGQLVKETQKPDGERISPQRAKTKTSFIRHIYSDKEIRLPNRSLFCLASGRLYAM